MSIEAIIKWLEGMIYNPKGISIPTEVAFRNVMAQDAIAILRTHPDTQPNEPLTLEELRKMEGDIVYCVPLNDWAKVVTYGLLFFGTDEYKNWNELIDGYGKKWLAYRHPPKED